MEKEETRMIIVLAIIIIGSIVWMTNLNSKINTKTQAIEADVASNVNALNSRIDSVQEFEETVLVPSIEEKTTKREVFDIFEVCSVYTTTLQQGQSCIDVCKHPPGYTRVAENNESCILTQSATGSIESCDYEPIFAQVSCLCCISV